MVSHLHRRLPNLLIGIGLAGLVFAFLLYLNRTVPPHQSGQVHVAAAPSAVKPTVDQVNTYTIPPTQPKFISIPTINISKARIISLGLDKTGAIATPSNIFDTGWYNQSSRPGALGAMFIYGHVSSWQSNGVFYNLRKLKPGNQIIITRGDNTTYTYQVTATKAYPYNNVDMGTVLAPTNASMPGLNLMTCTGHVIKGTSEFDQRLVVFSSLVRQ